MTESRRYSPGWGFCTVIFDVRDLSLQLIGKVTADGTSQMPPPPETRLLPVSEITVRPNTGKRKGFNPRPGTAPGPAESEPRETRSLARWLEGRTPACPHLSCPNTVHHMRMI